MSQTRLSLRFPIALKPEMYRSVGQHDTFTVSDSLSVYRSLVDFNPYISSSLAEEVNFARRKFISWIGIGNYLSPTESKRCCDNKLIRNLLLKRTHHDERFGIRKNAGICCNTKNYINYVAWWDFRKLDVFRLSATSSSF